MYDAKGTMSLFGNVMITIWVLQSSRLHFIGTWKSRYRKRFPISSTGFTPESSDINAPVISERKVIIHVDMVSLLGKIFDIHYSCLFIVP